MRLRFGAQYGSFPLLSPLFIVLISRLFCTTTSSLVLSPFLSSPLQSSLVLPSPPQSSLSFHPHPTLVHFPFSSILWEKLAAKREIEYILYRLVLHIRLPCFLPPVAIFPFVGCVFSVCPSVYLRFFNLVQVSTCELMSRGKIAPLAPSATHSLQTQRP